MTQAAQSQLIAELPPATQAIDSPATQWPTVLVATLLFAAVSVTFMCLNQSDFDLDSTSHYRNAQAALHHPYCLVDVWNRPLCTLLYCLPANLAGETGTQAMSLLMAIATGLITWRIALGQKFRQPALAVIFLYTMPMFLSHSFSTLTEIPMALVLALAFWAYQKRVFWALALLAGLLPAGRPEGFGLILLGIAVLLLHRRFAAIILAVAPFALWNWCGQRFHPSPGPWYAWVFANWPYSADSSYGHGDWYSFVQRLWEVLGCLAIPFLVLGFIWSLPRPRRGDTVMPRRSAFSLDWLLYPRDQAARIDVWAALIPLGLLIIHSWIWWRGKFGSNGQPRYLLMAAPLWALVITRGFEWVWPGKYLRWPQLWLLVAAMLGLYHAVFDMHLLPVPLGRDDAASNLIVAWDRQHQPAIDQLYPRLISTNPTLFTHLGYELYDRHSAAHGGGPTGVLAADNGTMLVWDKDFATMNADKAMLIPHDLIGQAHWVYVGQCAGQDRTWEVYLSPRDINGNPTVWTEPPFDWHFAAPPNQPHWQLW